jgi:2-phosphosulfolactate phosphatase
MQITVYVSSKYFKAGELADKTAVIIDLLRASSTMVTAIQNGCDRIIPAISPNEAVKIKKASEGDVLLGGEMNAEKIQGFDFGNSPLEYTEDAIAEKTIAYTTANGTVAVKRCEEASEILIGCILNAQAVAGKAVEPERDLALVCAGTRGKFSTDDVLAAGCIIDRILAIDPQAQLDDLGKVALKLYRSAKGDLLSVLSGSTHYEHLVELGMRDDIAFCVQEDKYPVVPVYREGVISK